MNTNIKPEYTEEVTIKKIEAKSILRKHKKVDSWFISRYGMNLYRGCLHNCLYCDGRAEKYQVEGEFGKDIAVKTNAPDLLEKELNPARKRIPLKKGFIMVGGGVGDSFQYTEKEYKLCRKVLEIIKKYNYPVHILTKSDLVLDYMDILKDIKQQSGVIVSFSLSTVDEKVSSIFEPGVPSPIKRLNAIEIFKQNGINSGVYLMPVIPYISDSKEKIYNSVKQIKDRGSDFIVFGGMTLKQGRQKDFFYKQLETYDKNLIEKYNQIYTDNKWGSPHYSYAYKIQNRFNEAAHNYKIPRRIPARLYNKIIDHNDLVVVILEQIDYLLRQRGENPPYGFAAYTISQLKEPISNLKHNLTTLKGVGKVTERIILEILDTGTSGYYEKLLY